MVQGTNVLGNSGDDRFVYWMGLFFGMCKSLINGPTNNCLLNFQFRDWFWVLFFCPSETAMAPSDFPRFDCVLG